MSILLSILSFFCIVCGFVVSSQPQELYPRSFLSRQYNESNSYTQQEIRPLNYDYSAPRSFYSQFLTRQTDGSTYKAKPNTHNREITGNYNNTKTNVSLNRKALSTGVFRTYGRGKAQITKKGESVVVPNTLGRKGIINSISENARNELNNSSRGSQCKECPEDHTVIAEKGNTFVILPEPCDSTTWNLVSGPNPGSKIREGIHFIRGILIPRNKYCQYQYQVIVRRCDTLKAHEEDTRIECSENNVWGSQCTVLCGPEKEALGPNVLECMENLKWSNPVPICKSKMDCSTPKVKNSSKVFCQTTNMTYVQGDFIPNGSTCRVNRSKKNMSIVCKDGTWRVSRKNKGNVEKNKIQYKNNPDIHNDLCIPNPCKNGGICLRQELNKSSPICICKPKTQGSQCEIVQCEYNNCQNGGLCFSVNQTDTCYCLPEFVGDKCQYRRTRYTGK